MYLDNIQSIEDLKQAYKRLAIKLHPDMPGGDEEAMKQLNNEYDVAVARLNRQEPERTTEPKANAYRDVICELIRMHGLKVELCGSWIWITGATYQYREALKAMGCRWSKNKGAWYWAGSHSAKSRRPMSMNYIRMKYGSQQFASNDAGLQPT